MVFYRNLKPSFSPSAKYLSEKERSCLHTSLLLKCLRFIPAITSRFLNVTKHVLVFEHAQQKFQAFSARQPFFLTQPNCLAVGDAQLCSREGTCSDLILAALFRRIRLFLHADKLNRLTSKTSSETDCATQTSTSFSYDGGGIINTGQRTGMTDGSGSTTWNYDLRGRMLQEVKTISGAPAAFTTAWNYNSADMPTTITYPDGEVVTNEYNDRMALQTVTGSQTYLADSSYDVAGRVTALTLGNGLVQIKSYYPWDQQGGRLHSLVTATIQNLSYSYDPVGNITNIANSANNETQAFAYDSLDRLTGWTLNSLPQETYGYDPANGNLTTKAGMTLNYNTTTVRPAHAVISTSTGNTYGYDLNGNQTTRTITGVGIYSLLYNAENQMTGVGGPNSMNASFSFDGDGKRVKSVLNVPQVIGGSTYHLGTMDVEQPDVLSLTADMQDTLDTKCTYRVFNNSATYAIQPGDVLEFDVFTSTPDGLARGGFDAQLSISGALRDQSGWLDQNGISIHPESSLSGHASNAWYSRQFNIGSKAGETLSAFKIAAVGQAAGTYLVLLDNIRITNGGVVQATIYQSGFAPAQIEAGTTPGVSGVSQWRAIKYYPNGVIRRTGYEETAPGARDGVFYTLSDHLGSSMLVTDHSGAVVERQNYKPWGEVRSLPNIPAISLTHNTFTSQYSYMDDPSTPASEGFGLMFYQARWYVSYNMPVYKSFSQTRLLP